MITNIKKDSKKMDYNILMFLQPIPQSHIQLLCPIYNFLRLVFYTCSIFAIEVFNKSKIKEIGFIIKEYKINLKDRMRLNYKLILLKNKFIVLLIMYQAYLEC